MPDGLLTALGIALDQLQDCAVASLVLPSQGTELGRGMTDSIVEVLHEQREQYSSILARSTTEELSEVFLRLYSDGSSVNERVINYYVVTTVDRVFA